MPSLARKSLSAHHLYPHCWEKWLIWGSLPQLKYHLFRLYLSQTLAHARISSFIYKFATRNLKLLIMHLMTNKFIHSPYERMDFIIFSFINLLCKLSLIWDPYFLTNPRFKSHTCETFRNLHTTIQQAGLIMHIKSDNQYSKILGLQNWISNNLARAPHVSLSKTK